MTAAFDFGRFYADGLRKEVRKGAWQWDCRASLAQYRKPFEVTLRRVPSGSRVLDWGCGNGHFSYFLLEQGMDVSAFSFDDVPAYSAGRPRYRHLRGDPAEPRRLPFDDATFDAVFSMGVLEHVYQTGGDEAASLAELRRVLKPGGEVLCFHFPNRLGWIEPASRLLSQAAHFHHRKYGSKDIRRLTAGAEMTLEERGLYNFLPRNRMRRLPRAISDGAAAVAALNAADGLLAAALPFSQNWYFVARKLDH